jgi:hypothetical protein
MQPEEIPDLLWWYAKFAENGKSGMPDAVLRPQSQNYFLSIAIFGMPKGIELYT